MEELRQFLPKNYNKEAVNMLLRDAAVFAAPNARRGGFRAFADGQCVAGSGSTAAGIENMAGLSEQDKENILGGNLPRVLGLI